MNTKPLIVISLTLSTLLMGSVTQIQQRLEMILQSTVQEKNI